MSAAAEMKRILDLPEEPSTLLRQVPSWVYTDNTRPGAKMSLNAYQAVALYEAHRAQGIVASLGVGTGKTLLSGLLPNMFDLPEGRDAYLLVPPSAVDKTYREMLEYDKHFRISRRLHVESYGGLSSVHQREDWFDRRNPGLLILDECHLLANKDANRTQGLLRWVSEHPEVFVAALSGTMTRKSVTDYAHLAALALRAGSPLPLFHDALSVWSVCLDETDAWSWARNLDWQKMQPLVDAFGTGVPLLTVPPDKRKEAVRLALQRRMDTCAGVVLSETQSSDAELTIRLIRDVRVPAPVQEALEALNDKWMRPDGEALESALEVARVGEQIAQGFHYFWDWPEGKADRPWLEARRNFRREIGLIARRGLRGSDSPGMIKKDLRKTLALLTLLGNPSQEPFFRECLRQIEPGKIFVDDLWDSWEAWVDEMDKPQPPRGTNWMDSFFIEDVLRRVRESDEPVLIWYSHKEIARRLQESGIEVCWPGDDPSGTKPRHLAVSVKSHSAAMNLQAWSRNLVLCPTSSALTWEQLLGRTHRAGQEAKVLTEVYAHTAQYQKAIQRARNRALYVEQSKKTPQRLNTAIYVED